MQTFRQFGATSTGCSRYGNALHLHDVTCGGSEAPGGVSVAGQRPALCVRWKCIWLQRMGCNAIIFVKCHPAILLMLYVAGYLRAMK